MRIGIVSRPAIDHGLDHAVQIEFIAVAGAANALPGQRLDGAEAPPHLLFEGCVAATNAADESEIIAAQPLLVNPAPGCKIGLLVKIPLVV